MCRERIDKMLPLMDVKELEDEEKIFGESYDSEEEQESSSEHISEIQVQNYGSEEGESVKDGNPAHINKSVWVDNNDRRNHINSGNDLKKMLADEDALSDMFAGRARSSSNTNSVNKIYEQYIEH